jgi:thiosulfate dehydrogenase (quinone) large subunit
MTTIVPPRHDPAARNGNLAAPVARDIRTTVTGVPASGGSHPAGTTDTGSIARMVARYSWVAARIAMGFIFLWAFVDKVFGFGFATPAGKGWVDGGNPTKGFLSGAEGPFAGFYKDIAGTTFANIAFMLGLAAIGTALLLGIGMRIAAGAGALMLVMMYTVVLPPTTNPLIDDHLILAVLLIGLAAVGAGTTFGLGRQWAATPLVTRRPWLK